MAQRIVRELTILKRQGGAFKVLRVISPEGQQVGYMAAFGLQDHR